MNPEDVLIRTANEADRALLPQLLEACHLEQFDVLAPGTRYWLAEGPTGELVGIVGLEFGAGAALLRTAGVRPEWRGRGLGARLTQTALEHARAAGMMRVYLFSTGAGPYWQRHGFREVPVPELVAALPDAPQVLRYAELGWLPTEVAWRCDL
jgi:N-acetylglutamate synthase-like GNAT family acetyltransferase